ncbi:MAG: NaeI family type II restriction endonuclease, partial [Gammaproteobacteria bacterium]
MTSTPASSSSADAELDKVEQRLYQLDPTGDRVAAVLRDTLDQLYDGQ